MQVMDPPEWNPPFSCYCTTWTESVPGDPSQSDLQEVLHVTKTYYQRLAKQTRRCQMQQAWVLKWGRRACFFRFCISKILKPDIVNISLFFFVCVFLNSFPTIWTLLLKEWLLLCWAFVFSSVCDFHSSQKSTDSAQMWPADRLCSPKGHRCQHRLTSS